MPKKASSSASRKKTKWPAWVRAFAWLFLAVLIIFGAYHNKKYLRRAYRYITHRYYKNTFKATDFPAEYSLHGIDISHYQDVIEWKKLFALDTYGDTVRFGFVFIKATEGLLIEDDMFDENWEDAKDNNYTRGAYHYFLPDRSATLQAKNFISSVKLEKGDLPPVVDVEETRGKPKEVVVARVKEYMGELEKQYHVKPIIYSNLNFIEDYLADDFKDYPFWVAHFYKDELVVEDSLQWLFWQHSDKADLAGINGNTDANVFNGSLQDFEKLRIK